MKKMLHNFISQFVLIAIFATTNQQCVKKQSSKATESQDSPSMLANSAEFFVGDSQPEFIFKEGADQDPSNLEFAIVTGDKVAHIKSKIVNVSDTSGVCYVPKFLIHQIEKTRSMTLPENVVFLPQCLEDESERTSNPRGGKKEAVLREFVVYKLFSETFNMPMTQVKLVKSNLQKLTLYKSKPFEIKVQPKADFPSLIVENIEDTAKRLGAKMKQFESNQTDSLTDEEVKRIDQKSIALLVYLEDFFGNFDFSAGDLKSFGFPGPHYQKNLFILVKGNEIILVPYDFEVSTFVSGLSPDRDYATIAPVLVGANGRVSENEKSALMKKAKENYSKWKKRFPNLVDEINNTLQSKVKEGHFAKAVQWLIANNDPEGATLLQLHLRVWTEVIKEDLD
jgi:hypothetical protein